MFCPQCELEYRFGYLRCTDCDVDLVEALADPEPGGAAELGEEKLAEVSRFMDVYQAQFAASVLEGSGIQSFLDNPFFASIAPHIVYASGGVRLYVRVGDLDRAIEVLESVSAAPKAGESTEEQ